MKYERVIFLILVCAWFALTRPFTFWNSIPEGMHVWTQTDRLALAQRYAEPNSNLFFPRTYNLKPNHANNLVSSDGVTAVDFPLPEFIAGNLEKILPFQTAFLLRITYAVLFIIGLFFLYNQLRLNGLPLSRAYGIMALIVSSPVIFHYSAGMLPSTAAFSFCLAGYMFVYNGMINKKNSALLWGLFLLVLAGMIRTPFYMHVLTALFFTSFLPLLKGSKLDLRVLYGILFILLPAVFWWFWNDYLRTNFGSMFLGKPLIPSSFEEGISLLSSSFSSWKWHYFSPIHIFVFGFGLLIILVRSFHFFKRNFYWQISLLSGLAGCAYAFLMASQFVYHDYYIIDALGIPFFLGIQYVFMGIPLTKKWLEWIGLFIVLLSAGLHLHSKHAERSEIGSWDRVYHANEAFKGSFQLLDTLSISSQSKILVLDAYSTNGPLLLMKRRGFSNMNTSEKELQKALELPFDYIAVADQFFLSDVVQNAHFLRKKLKRLGGNGNVSIYKWHENESTLFELLGISQALKVDSFLPAIENQEFINPLSVNHVEMSGAVYGPTFRDTILAKGNYGLLLSSELMLSNIWPKNVEWAFRTSKQSIVFKPSEYAQASLDGKFEAFFPFRVEESALPVECFLFNPEMSDFKLKSYKFSLHRRE